MRLSPLEQQVYASTLAAAAAAMLNKGKAKVVPTIHQAADFAKQAVIETRIQMRGDWNGHANGNGKRTNHRGAK